KCNSASTPRLTSCVCVYSAALNSKPRVPVMISVGGKRARVSGELIGATSGSFGFVPSRYPRPRPVPPVLDTTRASPSGCAVYVASPPNPAPVGEPAPAQKMPIAAGLATLCVWNQGIDIAGNTPAAEQPNTPTFSGRQVFSSSFYTAETSSLA